METRTVDVPADYIAVESIKPQKRQTIRDAVRQTCKRFYDQEFTGRNVFDYLVDQEPYCRFDRKSFYNNVRTAMTYLAKKQELVVVKPGSLGGNGSNATIYRNP